MKKPFEIKFLEFLEPENEYPTRIDIRPFISTNQEIIGINSLQEIGNKGYVLFWGNWDELDKTFEAEITIAGQGYLDEYRVKNILWLTNQSTIDTNASVRSSLKFQERISYVMAVAIVLTAIYAVTAYYKDDSQNLILIRKSMQRQEQILEKIKQSQRGIDSSLRIMAKKTSPKKNQV